MFIQWLYLEEEVIYHLGNVAASVHVLDPPLCREPGMEEEESHPDGVLGCGLVLQLCTGTQLCPQRQKYVHSQGQCDQDEKMVVEKRRQHRLDPGHAKQQLFFLYKVQINFLQLTRHPRLTFLQDTNPGRHLLMSYDYPLPPQAYKI